jgi:hypothetical protein
MKEHAPVQPFPAGGSRLGRIRARCQVGTRQTHAKTRGGSLGILMMPRAFLRAAAKSAIAAAIHSNGRTP